MSFDISENNVKALKFRDELIELLKKYKCSLSTTGKDDRNMVLEFHDRELNQCQSYTMTDEGEHYNLYVKNSSDCIMDTLIKDAFDKDCGEMSGLNSIYVTYGIVTNDGNKAKAKLIEIYNKFNPLGEVKFFALTRNDKYIQLKNGESYRWIKPNTTTSRGYRCRKIIIDRNITMEELYSNILPICRTKGLEDVEIF
ncbi:hypothetical protein [Clostridium haemolyticum]|uniref:Uncharacterized protein n=1 Tax=Clostridium haemolyticum NCTC 9693 TaxID=1443114 RepID=A0ABR4TBV0_CLOHA|nr:hypothetical protein [Clostridium haemolyticum]KEI14050.1 hypothetical protein Z960_p0049 [Clostridium haemolyticum NCTC 9693]